MTFVFLADDTYSYVQFSDPKRESLTSIFVVKKSLFLFHANDTFALRMSHFDRVLFL